MISNSSRLLTLTRGAYSSFAIAGLVFALMSTALVVPAVAGPQKVNCPSSYGVALTGKNIGMVKASVKEWDIYAEIGESKIPIWRPSEVQKIDQDSFKLTCFVRSGAINISVSTEIDSKNCVIDSKKYFFLCD